MHMCAPGEFLLQALKSFITYIITNALIMPKALDCRASRTCAQLVFADWKQYQNSMAAQLNAMRPSGAASANQI